MEPAAFARIVSRAAPPPEREDRSVFALDPGDPASLARRRERAVAALGGDEPFRRHVAELGIPAEAWLARLREVRLVGAPPDWARGFAAIRARLGEGRAAFDPVRAYARLRAEAVWPDSVVPRTPEALEGPLDALVGRLGTALTPTLLVESRLGVEPAWSERFDRSPALAFAFGRLLVDWFADLRQLGAAVAADRSFLADRFFGGRDPGALDAIQPGLGDPHAGGRSVAILRFERGPVVFKPKDLRVALAVAEAAARVGIPGMEVSAPLTRGAHAWEEVVAPAPVADAGEADRFHAALGGWTALLQGIGGVDFWFDNLFAAGPAARFFDFETATQPRSAAPAAVGRLAGEMGERFRCSPSDTGILPILVPTREGEEPTDIGCLSRPGAHRSPVPAPGGDGLLAWSESRFAPHFADGNPADASDHFGAFEDGYLRVSRTLATPANREFVLRALERFRDAPIRVIRLDTWTAYRAIRRSFAPRYLADGVWRELALHDAIPARVRLYGELREAAVRDLRRLDVPLYQTRLDSVDLDGMGGERASGHFVRDALAETRRRLETLARWPEADRVRWIRTGFGLRPATRRPAPVAEAPAPAAPGDLLAWAQEIAREISGAAVRDVRGAPTWIGVGHDVFSGCRLLSPLFFDVLSGRAGVGLALGALADALDRPGLATLAGETLEGAARDALEAPEFALGAGVGYAVGVGGLISALARDQALRPLARRLFSEVVTREGHRFSGPDFASGTEGLRPAAEALGEPVPGPPGRVRRYAPSSLPRLKPWLEPGRVLPLCPDRRAAARRRAGRDRRGSWFPEGWTDDRHRLSGVDGLPALAVCFARLAESPEIAGLDPVLSLRDAGAGAVAPER